MDWRYAWRVNRGGTKFMKTNRRGPRLLNYPLQRNVAPITAYRLFADPTQCERLWPSRPLDRQPGDFLIFPRNDNLGAPHAPKILPTSPYKAPLVWCWTSSTSGFAIAKLYRRVTAQSLASELFSVMQTHAIVQHGAKLAEGGSAFYTAKRLRSRQCSRSSRRNRCVATRTPACKGWDETPRWPKNMRRHRLEVTVEGDAEC